MKLTHFIRHPKKLYVKNCIFFICLFEKRRNDIYYVSEFVIICGENWIVLLWKYGKIALWWGQSCRCISTPYTELMLRQRICNAFCTVHSYNSDVTLIYKMVDVAKFWISCQQPELLRKASQWQPIQNLASSSIVWHQCDIQKVPEYALLSQPKQTC